MADCLQELWAILENTFEGVEQFCEEVDEVVEEIVDEVETFIWTEFDQFVEEIVYPFLDLKVEDEFEQLEDDDLEIAITYPVDPIKANNPACVNCRHYHGQVYGGNLLVCGMHPYGWETNTCPDWEREDVRG